MGPSSGTWRTFAAKGSLKQRMVGGNGVISCGQEHPRQREQQPKLNPDRSRFGSNPWPLPLREAPCTRWASNKGSLYCADKSSPLSGLNSRPSWHHRARSRHPDPLPAPSSSSAWDSRVHQPGPPRPGRSQAWRLRTPWCSARGRPGPAHGPRPAASAPPPSPPRPPEPLSGGGGPRTGFPQTRGRVEEEAAEPRILLRRRRAPPASTARPRRLLGLTEPRRGKGRGGCVEAAGTRAEAARPAAAAALLCGPGQGKRSGRRGEFGVPLPPRLMATTLGTSGTLRPWRPRRRLLGPQPRPLW
ncbi:unnamed protein product [Rangifer tarandus platyrhynchus]|uniref:Uncharacterized protein n=2 Tax=Rangifer tarandus platyrhynchus TaxID=3082113 RepID=A0ACB0EJ41_RANTA|nr:unnamed protein product [Rangifer tarandus platyrhynchus]CAI9700631.1 unnamed protein product [Rangifer tarandus platyrhynchus]